MSLEQKRKQEEYYRALLEQRRISLPQYLEWMQKIRPSPPKYEERRAVKPTPPRVPPRPPPPRGDRVRGRLRGFPEETLEELAEEEAKIEKHGYQDYVPGMPEVAPRPISFAQAIAPTITLTRLDFGTYARQEVTTRLPGFQLRDIFGPAAARPGRPYGAPAGAPAIGAAPTPETPVGRLPTLEEVVKQAQAIAYAPPTVITRAEMPPAAPTPPPVVPAAAPVPTPIPTPTPTVTAAGPPERPWVPEVYKPTPAPLPVEPHPVPYAKEVKPPPERVKAGLISRPW